MSWDIFVQDLPKNASTIEEIPDDFAPGTIGKRSQIIEKSREIVPAADFSEPSWGRIRGDNWSIEVNMGKDEECSGFCFHVRGSDAAAGVVAAVMKQWKHSANGEHTATESPDRTCSAKEIEGHTDSVLVFSECVAVAIRRL